MTRNKNVCYYGLHVGCLNATSPDCRTCAEHLTHAVNHMAHEATICSVEADNEGARYTLTLRREVVT